MQEEVHCDGPPMRPRSLALVLAAPLAAGPALAQVAYQAPTQRGALGGGFVEMLMTGREPGRGQQQPYGQPTMRPHQAAHPAASQPVDPYANIDPFADPIVGPGRRRIAALPIDPDAGLIGAAPHTRYRRQEVSYDGPEAPGTIVVDTPNKFLYHIQSGGRAVRYGIGVGRPGFEWSGMKSVTMKKEWPDWRPPPEMRKRRPDLPLHMAGGPGNPLGARALYLGSSLYRIHGTNEPHTIGRNVSSGCIRMMNDDVIHLYTRVGVGTRVKVI